MRMFIEREGEKVLTIQDDEGTTLRIYISPNAVGASSFESNFADKLLERDRIVEIPKEDVVSVMNVLYDVLDQAKENTNESV